MCTSWFFFTGILRCCRATLAVRMRERIGSVWDWVIPAVGTFHTSTTVPKCAVMVCNIKYNYSCYYYNENIGDIFIRLVSNPYCQIKQAMINYVNMIIKIINWFIIYYYMFGIFMNNQEIERNKLHQNMFISYFILIIIFYLQTRMYTLPKMNNIGQKSCILKCACCK